MEILKVAYEANMVSVIIPTYNRGSMIKKSVESVLNQTYHNIEVIVVDDCSTDNTEKIMQQIKDCRVKYIKLKDNSGACVARNTGIYASKGEYIAFQDSDDFWRSGKLDKQLDCLKKYNSDVSVCRASRHGYGNLKTVHPTIPEGILRTEDLIAKSLVSTQTILAKREIFQEIVFDPKLKRRQDYDWVIRAVQKYSFSLCDDILVDIYLQEDSITNLKAQDSIEAFQYLLNKHSEGMKKYPSFQIAMLHLIGYYKVVSGRDARYEFKKLCELEKTNKNKIYYFLCRLQLLKYYYILRK